MVSGWWWGGSEVQGPPQTWPLLPAQRYPFYPQGPPPFVPKTGHLPSIPEEEGNRKGKKKREKGEEEEARREDRGNEGGRSGGRGGEAGGWGQGDPAGLTLLAVEDRQEAEHEGPAGGGEEAPPVIPDGEVGRDDLDAE